MVDNDFNAVDEILFDTWNFKGLQFYNFPGQWYNAWRPIPKLALSVDHSVNNYEGPWGEPDPFPEWEWPCVDIKGFSYLLKSIHEFTQSYPQSQTTK